MLGMWPGLPSGTIRSHPFKIFDNFSLKGQFSNMSAYEKCLDVLNDCVGVLGPIILILISCVLDSSYIQIHSPFMLIFFENWCYAIQILFFLLFNILVLTLSG